jgi:hypothetical protein
MNIHWAEKRNKNIKASNKKSFEKNPPGELRTLKTAADAPPNLNQSANLFPEAVLFLLVKDHPIIKGGETTPKRKAPTSKSTQSADDDEDGEDDDDDDEVKMASSMSIKGSFTSRKKQRANDTRLKRRALISNKNNASGMKEKAAFMHASAAKKQADNQLAQTRLAAIESASKLGMSKEMLQGYLKETLNSLFAIDKPATSPALPAASPVQSTSDTQTQAASALPAAEQLSMMSGGGVTHAVSGYGSDTDVVELDEGTGDQ